MTRKRAPAGDGDPTADPFDERAHRQFSLRARLLGAEFGFETDHRQLLALVRQAYGRLPPPRRTGSEPQLALRLVLADSPAPRQARRREPPPVQPVAGAGLVGGFMAGSSFIAVNPEQRSGLVIVDRHLLAFPYHVRYELIEFAVYCLAARALQLVPLHAACVAGPGGAALLLGGSGAGKSTLMLQSLVSGLQFMAEDSVLVRPRGLLASGVANYLHIRRDSARFVAGSKLARHLQAAPVIQRRSGVRKLEIDLRGKGLRLARAPQPLRALVFLSARPAGRARLLRPLTAAAVRRRLQLEQPYAAHQAGWEEFLGNALRLPAFELRRAAHPREAVAALARLLD